MLHFSLSVSNFHKARFQADSRCDKLSPKSAESGKRRTTCTYTIDEAKVNVDAAPVFLARWQAKEQLLRALVLDVHQTSNRERRDATEVLEQSPVRNVLVKQAVELCERCGCSDGATDDSIFDLCKVGEKRVTRGKDRGSIV